MIFKMSKNPDMRKLIGFATTAKANVRISEISIARFSTPSHIKVKAKYSLSMASLPTEVSCRICIALSVLGI